MRRLVCIAFLGLAIYHTLGLIPGVTEDSNVTQASLKRSMNVGHQSSPFMQVRIPNTANLAGKIDFSFVSDDQIRVNGHLFDLIGLSIFEGFIDLRIVLNDTSNDQDLINITKDFQTEKGGLSLKSGPVFIPFTPPTAFTFSMAVDNEVMHTSCPFLAENPLVGFEEVPGQPPRI